jgi:TP901 family phage tail tape measure protein
VATDPLALESLFVKILVDADPFTAGMQKVTKAVDDLEARLVAFGTKVASIATTSLAPFANSLKGIGSFLNSVTSLKFSNFGPARRGVEEFATFFKDISATFGTAEVAQTAASFQKVGGFLNSMSGFMSKLEAIDLGTFSQRWQSAVEAFTSTAKMVESIDVTKLEPVGKSFKNLSSIVNAAGRFELTKGKTDSIAGFFTGLVDGLNVLTPEAMAKAEQVGKLSNSLARSLRSFFVLPITPAAGANVSAFFEKLVGGLGTVSPEVIDKSRAIGRLSSSLAGSMRYFTTVSATPFTTTSVTSFFTNLLTEVSAVPDGVLEKVTAVNKATRGVAGAVQALGKMSAVNMAAVLTNGKQLVAWLNQLGGVTPAVLNNVSGLGKALSGFARFFTAMGGYGGPLPPIVANIKNVSSAAGGAAGPIRSLTGRFRDFGTSIASASGNLSMMRMSLLGFAGIGVGMFAKFDDSLVRTLAHMERLNNEPMEMTQRPVEESIRKISSASPTSRMDLAKGFDAFARSGMSAGMSMKMLGISESFALAGSMPLRETSVHLADIFRSLGLATGDVNEGYVKMRNLTDLLTGTAFMTGSTAKEMTEAIGPRFTAALKMTNMSLEDTIALVGAYSAVGIRGSQASDRAAQFLISMSKASTENSVRWKQLGVDVYDAAGKMFPLEKIVGQLSGKFAAMSDMQRIATLSLLGFNQRTITAILPILDMGEGLKLLKQKMKEMGGTTEDVANIIRRDFMSQLKILWNSVTEVAIAIGRNLAPILGAVAYWLTGVAEALASLNPAVQSLIVGFIALSAAILVTIKLGSILGVWVALGVVWTGLSVSVMTVVRAFLFLGPLTFGLGMAFVNMGRAAGVAIYGIWAAIKFTFCCC